MSVSLPYMAEPRKRQRKRPPFISARSHREGSDSVFKIARAIGENPNVARAVHPALCTVAQENTIRRLKLP